MIEPLPHGSEELEAFVRLLRSATPDEGVMEAAREGVLRAPQAPPPASGA